MENNENQMDITQFQDQVQLAPTTDTFLIAYPNGKFDSYTLKKDKGNIVMLSPHVIALKDGDRTIFSGNVSELRYIRLKQPKVKVVTPEAEE